MRILFLIFALFLFSTKVYSNEVEIIELHESKSLDQLVLDQINQDTNESNNEVIDNTAESSEEIISEDTTVIEETITSQNNFWAKTNSQEVSNLLNYSRNINSKVLQTQFDKLLNSVSLDYENEKNREIFFLIINYFYKNGSISKAYNLLNTVNTDNHENADFYNMIKLNYLLSTFKLEELCNFKTDLNEKYKLTNFLIEKTDIFCLSLENNISEADLLNTILLETEIPTDNNFQNLLSIILGKNLEKDNNIIFEKEINSDLIFLYSAMARIADLPLNENFLQVDSKNLAIPIILNKASPIELRIKAANSSYLNETISIESLAALYQSVDFDTNQFNNPEETILGLSNNVEKLMAYYYQLINVQIFPSERLEALTNFWRFAKENNLQEIAYALSYKTIESLEISAEYLKFSLEIATCLIYNNNFEVAYKWISFYENSQGADDKSSYVKIIFNLYSTEEINSITEIINVNFDKLSNSNLKQNEELIYVLLQVLGDDTNKNLSEDYNFIYDQRLMPSLFILQNIQQSIKDNNNENFLIYSVISLSSKDWIDIHPAHLNLILKGLFQYENGIYLKNIIIEIFKNFKIL